MAGHRRSARSASAAGMVALALGTLATTPSAVADTPPVTGFSQDAGAERLYFVRTEGDATDVYAGDGAGTGPTALKLRRGTVHFPVPTRVRVTNDGDRLAAMYPGVFAKSGTAPEVRVASDDGSCARVVYSSSDGGNVVGIDWAPDGLRMAMALTAVNGPSGLHILDTATPGATAKLVAQGVFSDVAWHPTGDRIAFVRTVDGSDDLDIDLVNPDGTNRRALVTGGTIDHSPAWSPGGTRLAFVRYDRGTQQSHLYVAAADGTGSRRVSTLTDVRQPTWTPDGTRIVVSSVKPNPATSGEPQGVVSVHPETGEYVQRTTGVDLSPVVSKRLASKGDDGYGVVTAAGGVHGFGNACPAPSGLARLNRPIVGAAATPSGKGHWLLGGDGGVFSYGDARFFGSTGNLRLNQPVVGMAATPTGGGYWFVAADGGVFAFGDARFFGSTGAIRLNQPIVGMAAAPDGKGYWLVARDGGIFAFGSARFLGSTGAIRLNQPVVGMAATRTGGGYWLVASDGGVFAFGDARFLGSTGAIRLNQPIVGIQPLAVAEGYRMVAVDGGIFNFGAARHYGSAAGAKLPAPVVTLLPPVVSRAPGQL